MDLLRQKRLVNLFILLIVCFLALAGRLWYVQVRQGALYSGLALEQVSRWVPLEETARGEILDRNLIPLTGTKEENRIIIFPDAVGDKAEVSRGLAEILGIDTALVSGYLQGEPCTLPFLPTPVQASSIQNRGWTGVMVFPVKFRYGDRQLAAQVIGHVGKISSWQEFVDLSKQSRKLYHFGDMVGKAGLEKYYEGALKGSWPQKAVRVFADARGNLLGGPGFLVDERAGDSGRQDLVLTLDARIQEIVEDVMDRKVGKGAVVVMEAGSGDILALASRPGFNPEHLEDNGALAGGNYFDHCTALYQPGSIFKIVVATAALEEGIFTPASRFECTGEKDQLVPCWKKEGHGELDFRQAFAESCNPVFARVGLELGAGKVIEYARRLGLDNQSIGGYPAPADPRQDLNLIAAPYNLAGCSVGQGPVLVTPIQIAAMTNAILTDGMYQEPRLVKEIRNGTGKGEQVAPPEKVRAMSPSTAGVMRSLLEEVTAKGSGQEAMVPVNGSAGKTGSAQIANNEGLVNAWFTGYAPLTQSRYIITVLVEDGESGSKSAAPVFKEIMEQILALPDTF
ncbi:Stage V sporulation protein D [Pelotomaculum schinkii]|uniref:Stage V sporulation protein D n=1 Tax=Pelotomaculum schinkii TaxID=78350 RepID=A0A4Y7RCY4_9FIRM|nr:penicillin-binding transpeptidase domain-containing protein [Pelotomaculum schinkii]TEB06580.1 Stage V sporulation protein D [Pelotomaculum schinkii]